MRQQLLDAGVRNLKEFGYPSVNTTNILTDQIYQMFFTDMLKDAKGKRADIDKAVDELLAEIATNGVTL